MENDSSPEMLALRLDAVGDVTVTTADAIAGGFCVSGLVGWLKVNDFDQRTALRVGLSGREVLSKNDAYGNRAVNIALKKVEQ